MSGMFFPSPEMPGFGYHLPPEAIDNIAKEVGRNILAGGLDAELADVAGAHRIIEELNGQQVFDFSSDDTEDFNNASGVVLPASALDEPALGGDDPVL